ncbi:MAG: hypothetical protein RLZ98_1727 [Pseudomonadota bacterium]
MSFMRGSLIAVAAAFGLATAHAAPLTTPTSGPKVESKVELIQAKKKAKRTVKRRATQARSCGEYKFRQGSKCVDARAKRKGGGGGGDD